MKRTTGKVLGLLLTLVMLVSLLPTVALAASTAENPVARIGLDDYNTLGEAVQAAAQDPDKEEEPVVIKLLHDVEDGSGVIVPEKSNIIFDFANHTYKVTGNYAGSHGTETQCFQLLKDSTIVMKNGTIIGDGDNCRMMIQNYSNLTLENMVLDATQGNNRILYTLSNNNGNTKITKGTKIVAAPGQVAFDVCSFQNYPSVSVVVDDATIVGDVEWSGKNGDGKYTSELVIKGGTFDGEFKTVGGTTPNIKVSGGTFTNLPENVTVPDKTPVAEITTPKGTENVIGNSKIQSAIGLAAYYDAPENVKVNVKSGDLDIFGIDCGTTFTNSGTGKVVVNGVIGMTVATGETKTLAHVLGWTVSDPASCSRPGVQDYYKCRSCGKIFEDKELTVEITDLHAWSEDPAHILPVKPHTADEQGWYTDENGHYHKCSVCGETFDVQEHTFETVVDKEATATTEGTSHQHCTVCGYDGPSVVIPVKPEPVKPDSGAPATGDSASTALYAGLMVASVLGLGVVAVYKRKDRQA